MLLVGTHFVSLSIALQLTTSIDFVRDAAVAAFVGAGVAVVAALAAASAAFLLSPLLRLLALVVYR